MGNNQIKETNKMDEKLKERIRTFDLEQLWAYYDLIAYKNDCFLRDTNELKAYIREWIETKAEFQYQ